MHCIGVIPARYQSTRFPGKPLANIDGSPMIQWVYERALQAQTLEQVIVATDNRKIRDVVEGFGGRVMMTSDRHRSGTDRVAEVSRNFDTALVVNIQGDEPLIEPDAIDTAVRPLERYPDREMSTLATPITSDAKIDDPNLVKVVFDKEDRALYFSRSPIPFRRESTDGTVPGEVTGWQHIGLYVYRREFLLRFAGYSPGQLEQSESLEQLRALEYGHTIHVEKTGYRSLPVDTPEDLERVLRQLADTRKE